MDERIMAFKTITERNNQNEKMLKKRLEQQKQKDIEFSKKIIEIIYGN